MNFQQFLNAYHLRFWQFTMLLHFSLKKNSPKLASATARKWSLIARRCSAFCSKTHYNIAPKRTAICTKMHCNMHQNALQYAAKRTAICTKTQPKPMKINILELIYRHFDHLDEKQLVGFCQCIY